MRTVVLALCIIGCLTGPAAAEPDLAEQQAILDSIVERARSFELPDNIEVVIRQTTPPPRLSEKEIDELRRLAFTDANAKLHLDQFEAENKNHGISLQQQLMYKNKSVWRLNTDRVPKLKIEYTDTGMNEKTKWQLSDRQLQYAGQSESVNNFAVEEGPAVIQRWLVTMSTGVVWPLDQTVVVLDVTPESGGLELYRVEVNGAARYHLAIDTPDDGDPPRIVRIDEIPSVSNKQATTLARLSQWTQNSKLGVPVAGRYESTLRDGSPEVVVEVIGASELQRDMVRVASLPAADGVDPFRGPYTFSTVKNLGAQRLVSIDSQTRDILSEVRVKRGRHGSLRLFGFIAGAAAVLVVLVANHKYRGADAA